jgi:hypothetical protein
LKLQVWVASADYRVWVFADPGPTVDLAFGADSHVVGVALNRNGLIQGANSRTVEIALGKNGLSWGAVFPRLDVKIPLALSLGTLGPPAPEYEPIRFPAPCLWVSVSLKVSRGLAMTGYHPTRRRAGVSGSLYSPNIE